VLLSAMGSRRGDSPQNRGVGAISAAVASIDPDRVTRVRVFTVSPSAAENRAQAARRYVASTCTNAHDGFRPFRPVRAGGTQLDSTRRNTLR
jgi:hypothetical protein